MSQLALTQAERRAALQRLGYGPREAEFLCLAALVSGYFLRRQYCRFLGKANGGTAAALLEKVLVAGHATSATGCHNTHVYHLGSRPFYAALGQADNRNRRTRTAVAIKNKLMCLDFVLDHSGRQFLATEQEKVSYFRSAFGIPLADLPVKQFRSPTAADATDRYFVDKYPIAVASDRAPVSFSFVDEGLVTGSRFETFLRRRQNLFTQLGKFELLYAAAADDLFRPARRTFAAFLEGLCRSVGAIKTPEIEQMLAHFADRARYESGDRDGFDRTRLIQLRNDRRAYSGAQFEDLYQRWQTGGGQAVRAALASSFCAERPVEASFQTYLLAHNYDVFGSLRTAQANV